MGQKTNPISLRLNIDRHFDSCWYPKQSSEYGESLQRDLNIREYLKTLFGSLGLHTGRINVQMFPKKLHIHYFFHPDPLRASQRRRSQNLQHPQESKVHKGLSFLRSVRKQQKLSPTQPSLTFREILALERQKMPILSKNTPKKQSSLSTFLSREISKILSFKETLKNLQTSSFSKKSGEAGKLFLFKGFSAFKFSQDIFRKILDPQGIFLKKVSAKNLDRPKKIKLQDFSLLNSDFQGLAEIFFQKSHKVSENLGGFENLCRFLTLSQPLMKTRFQNISHSQEILSEYSKFFQMKKEVDFGDKKKKNESLTKSSLWSNVYTQRALFLEQKNLKHIERMIDQSFGSETVLVPFKVHSRTRSAHFLCQTVIQQFQKNLSFRQIYKNLLKDIQADPDVQGIRFVCSGRFGGIEMARVESRKYGQTSLHVFSSHIDYAHGHALTSSGLLGVKIWISYRPISTNPSLWGDKWSYPDKLEQHRKS